MKSIFSRLRVLALLTTSCLLLVACASPRKAEQAKVSSESSRLESSSQAKESQRSDGTISSSSSSSIKGPSRPNASASSGTTASSGQASSSQTVGNTNPKSSRTESEKQVEVDMDVNAVARGQYDSIAGTWTANDGSRLIFNKTTLVAVIDAQKQAKSRNYVVSKGDFVDGSGQYEASLSNDNGVVVTAMGDLRFVSKKAAVSGPAYEQDTIQLTSNGATRVYFKASSDTEIPNDVTVTDNQASIPINSGLSDSGSYILSKTTIVKNSPSVNAPVVFYLSPGYRVNYDMKVRAEGHTWLSYISYSGVRRYVLMED